ncbi:MAG TPA: histidine phosphatase family protein [Kofleriaceae bacterium]|nr:histidine phosphatase family protein [Kofleriaceae bacterium]
MPRLYLARHGETEWNAIGRLQGHTDVPLNERGRQQARELAAAVRTLGIGSVITSDLARARETGAIIAGELGLGEPRVVAELRERRIGVFEGLTRDECMVRYPEAWAAWHARTGVPDGAEALAEATARMHAVLGTLAEEPGDPALVVSHGGVMRLWLVDVLGRAVPPLHNGITFAIERDGAAWSAVMLRG